MRRKSCLLKMLSFAIVLPVSAIAANSNSVYEFDGVSLNAALGRLSGEAHEYVYEENSNNKISQLNWKINSALIAKAEINYDLKPWLTLNGKGFTTLAKGNGLMDDYDWLNPNQFHWTHWSHHDDTHLSYAKGMDLNLQAWIFHSANYKFGVLGGYERNSFSFNAKGGCYQYANGRDVGCFAANEPGIGYRQTFSTPYLGLAGKYTVNNFELNLLLKASNWVNSKDNDEHYARNLTFKEWGNGAKYHSITLNTGYYFTRNMKLFAEASYTRYGNTKADTQIRDNTSGIKAYIPNSAGLDNKNYMVALGLQYTI
ncbi:omptin family outer membrane protease [Legionella sp. D16C41]|uniref:omptin family outer membrane protease n=1 Tax=Legionella sp. D16C41 TaxID=3402688 RepID=UPI003AF6A728